MAPRFQNARSNGNTLTITVVDNSNPVTKKEIDFRHLNAELRAEVIQLKAQVVELESLHSEVTNLLDSVRPSKPVEGGRPRDAFDELSDSLEKPNNSYRGEEL